MNTLIKKILSGAFVAALFLLLWNYQAGYDQSIDWEVITTAEVVEFPAWTMENSLLQQQIEGEKYLLEERYSGSEIKRNLAMDQLYLGMIWIGLCVFLAASSYFNRYLFFTVIAGLALMINRLNLFEVGLFGIDSKWVMILPFVLFTGPLVYFNEYRKHTHFLIRVASLLIASIVLRFGIGDPLIFTDHFIAHSTFTLGLVAIIFLFIVSEELVFTLLYVVSSAKGGKSNHLHFMILSLFYLGNLILYYLNKAGIFENSFFYFDPFILLAATCLISLWSMKFKAGLADDYVPDGFLPIVVAGLGLVTFGYLSLSMHRGVDAVYQSFHYFILYFHIGFGVFFFFYVIANFLDPLAKGLQVYKIAYRERNFPYVTARLGGLVCIAAFYFLSGQEAYNLLRSGYYNYLGAKEKSLANDLLSKEYLIHAAFLGYNTHYPNYQFGWLDWNTNKVFSAKTNFFNAAQRYPSPYAWVNYGNIEVETNPTKVQATYEEALRKMRSPEMKNNLGLIHLGKGDEQKALSYFQEMEGSDDWNNAPMINKWKALHRLDSISLTRTVSEYQNGNFGVKANMISTRIDSLDISFNTDHLASAPPLHRQAYLLNSCYVFTHDSIETLIRRELTNTTSQSAYNRLAMALSIYLYKSGEVNKSFRLLDELQANAHQLEKGKYLDAMGKFALDQGAYRSALDFFKKAVDEGYQESKINQLEALAAMGQTEIITQELLKIIESDPGLTAFANDLLQQLKDYQPTQKEHSIIDLREMDYSDLIDQIRKNAFNEDLLLAGVEELGRRDTTGAYELLVDAIEINPYSSPLLQAYVLEAVELSLDAYAAKAIKDLEGLMSESEYILFEKRLEDKKDDHSKNEWK